MKKINNKKIAILFEPNRTGQLRVQYERSNTLWLMSKGHECK